MRLLSTLQRGAADGSIGLAQAVGALSLRLEMLSATPHAMLEHVRAIPEAVRMFARTPHGGDGEACELMLTAASILETWGHYGAAREALAAIESCCDSAMRARARHVAQRVAFGETGRVDEGVGADEADAFWTSAPARYTRAFFMWIGGAAAAVHQNREALLAIEDPDIDLWMPLMAAACSAGVGDSRAAMAALEICQERVLQRATRPDPASTAFFHALRGRLQAGRDAALAEADFRAAMGIVESVANSLPWAYVMVLQAEALLRTDLDAADRIVAAVEASPVRQNFVVRLLMRRLSVARAMASGQHDALQLAIQQHAETQQMLHRIAASPDEFNAVLRYWQERWDLASGVGAVASKRNSSAVLDRFLLLRVLSRAGGGRAVLRGVAASHCVGRALGWTDAELRYLRSLLLYQALPGIEQSVIALPPFPPSREDQLRAVIAAGALIASGLEDGRDATLEALRLASSGEPAATRAALSAAIGLVTMQDVRRVVDFHVGELARCLPSVSV